MSKISLRDYLSEIDRMIDQGQIGPAVEHCRHILATFPKHVDSYRMMGKAYLEDKSYGEAGDIFQRVLSSVPDDFVSHVGLSIIRENDEKLDAAIWHMERAFESQPSNRAVQDELRRLYGEREGRAPAKVRLTRGALARMYAHGDLFNQAISELTQALDEDGERPDLQVLLAEMYFNTGRNSEAISVCNQILDGLPYCLYANHLMADILKQNDRAAEAEAYLQKVAELDPYASLVDSKSDPATVAAESVTLQKMGASAEAEEPLGDTEPHRIQPDDMPEAAAATPAASQAFEEEELPAWLSGDMSEEEDDDEAEDSMESLFETDSPEMPWGDDEDEKASPTLQSDQPEDIADEPVFDATPASASAEAPGEGDLPEWLKELRPDAAGSDDPGDKSMDEEAFPDMEDASQGAAAAPTLGDEVPEDSIEEEDMPEWLKNVAGDQPEPGTSGTSSLPAFDENMEPKQEQQKTGKLEDADMEPTALNEAEEDEGVAWLEGLAAEQGADEEEMTTAPGERRDQAPAWTGPEDNEDDDDGALDWLDDMVDDLEGSDQPQAEMPADSGDDSEAQEPASASGDLDDLMQSSGETTPEWLRDLAQEAEEGPELPKPETSTLEEPPDWLDDLRSDDADEDMLAEGPATDDEGEEDADVFEQPAPQLDVEEETAAEENEDEEFEEIQLENMDWLDQLGASEEDSAQEFSEDQEVSETTPDDELAASSSPPEHKDTQEDIVTSEWVPEESFAEEPEGEAAEPEIDLSSDIFAADDEPAKQMQGTKQLEEEEEMAPAEAVATIRSEAELETKAEQKKKDKQAEAAEQLESARQALNYDNLEEAARQYGKLVRSRRLVDEVIADLQAATQRHPRSVVLRQALGDAYMRTDRLRDALESYTKAEDLL